MSAHQLLPLATLIVIPAAAGQALAAEEPECRWLDVRRLTVEGQGWAGTAGPFDRFPARAKGVVRDPVWDLSRHSAGIAARFLTDAPNVSCRWTLTSDSLAMEHMPSTGVSGVDLYVRMPEGQRRLPGQVWRWTGLGRPTGQTSQGLLADGLAGGMHEYLLYLPLYNGVKSVEVGVPPSAQLLPAPERPAGRAKPVVLYGTSITHGGCASRPGMAYPAIIGRMLDRPTINLGFSGNGTMDESVGALLAELDVAAYVLDCCPNLTPELVTERTAPLVRQLRAAHPQTPVVLVENIEYQDGAMVESRRNAYLDKNAALKVECAKLLAEGVGGLHYVEGESLFGEDGEATVDGTHATDLGFLRIAEHLAPVLKAALYDAA